MMKKVSVKIIVCMAVLSAAFVFSNCKSVASVLPFSEPKVYLRSIDFSRISFTGVELLCRVNVENPNSFDIPFPEVTWEFFINTNSFISGVVKTMPE